MIKELFWKLIGKLPHKFAYRDDEVERLSRQIAYKPKLQQNGVCCSCGYDGEVETSCEAREDKTHCEHWWEGSGGNV